MAVLHLLSQGCRRRTGNNDYVPRDLAGGSNPRLRKIKHRKDCTPRRHQHHQHHQHHQQRRRRRRRFHRNGTGGSTAAVAQRHPSFVVTVVSSLDRYSRRTNPASKTHGLSHGCVDSTANNDGRLVVRVVVHVVVHVVILSVLSVVITALNEVAGQGHCPYFPSSTSSSSSSP